MNPLGYKFSITLIEVAGLRVINVIRSPLALWLGVPIHRVRLGN